MSEGLPRSYMQLKLRYRAMISYTGMILLICAGLMLVPVVCVIFWPAELRLAYGFALPALGLGLLGFWLWRRFQLPETVSLTTQHGSAIVVLSWSIACIASAFPFMMVEGMDFTHGLFEATSGWTTTGLTVLDYSAPSRMILLWRGLMQFAGGAGLAIIMLASITGPAGVGLPTAEGRTEQLLPHVRASVRLVLTLYLGYAVVGIIAYWIAGMPIFDSINHTFAALSTGGFSTRAGSIGAFNSLRIEVVSIVLMLLGATNFLTAWELLRRRYHRASRSGELRLVAVVIPVAAILLGTMVTGPLYGGGTAARVAIFESVSALTGTGFTTVSYAAWSGFGILILIALMVIGGGAGSTSAGIKQYRIYLLLMSLRWRIQRAFLPSSAVVERYIWRGDRKDFVDESRIREAGDYTFLYLSALLVAALIISSAGFALQESLFEAASIVGIVGLSVGVVSAAAPAAVLWTAIIGMFPGRLEFHTVIIGVLQLLSDTRKVIFVRRSPTSPSEDAD